uniref:Transcription factor bHLH128-like isoform X1 n=1 Tax=Cymbidium ensifolium TaxID=78740 RepID=A0A515HG10_CYMEN|nr:transcription factor bHLH128-like isoform X1 [Cymbidium ensifolium]
MNQLGSSGNGTPPANYRPMGLMRYGSAPGSLLSSIADSVIGGSDEEFSASGSGETVVGTFFSGDSPCLTSESSCLAATRTSPNLDHSVNGVGGYGGSYPPLEYGGCGEIAGGSHLIRHSSSPAGFFANVLVDSGLSPKGAGNYTQVGEHDTRMKRQRLSSQWSFSRQDSLSQISGISVAADMAKNVSHGSSPTEASGNFGYSYISGNIPLSSWDGSNPIVTAPPNKRGKDNNGDIMTSFNNLESQLNRPCTSVEMEAVEKYLNMQQEHVRCELRAKRGCAMHPRSIAERERRTRISKRLKRLQDLVPNMDKQTNTSDMLDLALHYIKELQSQVQKLNQERAECTCTVKQDGG